MNPQDAPNADWRMYYNNTWMIHKKHGPCHVQVRMNEETGESFFQVVTTEEKTYKRINSKDLSLFFPLVGSFNVGGSALYLGRRAQRQMRKSASYPDTYYITWGSRRPNQLKLLKQVVSPEYSSLESALEQVSNGTPSVAISRNWIIAQKTSTLFNLIYKGTSIGTMSMFTGKVKLNARSVFPESRIKAALRKEGIRC